MHNLRRERIKGSLNSLLGKGKLREEPNMTAEEFERIRQQLKEREAQQKRYTTYMTFLVLASIIAIVVLLWGILSYFTQ